ncbi:NmrA-like family domain-containing protein 1 [Colletotrichum spaethianum]|uniref:NmrA-like family domain-containing protein 1 n=1 Tax=Colletotrichum spaethianum TaxID=700344 RepID=A0AA37UJC1_9PEZI|nr:NmrA-like family domain-containing protein 1 [Colletotrichum spaethianum]GKT47731.1 NmrA-like family domain-containing protein 1 [Colletotrichum spaethianum]
MTISTDSSAPLIVVVGATGIQGGSVIDNLQASARSYRMRGITRDSSKPKAKALADRGVEVASCNLVVGNAAEIENAFRGATYIFIVTNYWEHMDKDREEAEGKLMVDCAKAVGVKLLLVSSEPSATKASGGRLTKVYHFDSKAAISDYAREVGVPFVDIHVGGYMNNYTTFMRPRPGGDGSYIIDGTWSETAKIPLIDTAHDLGLFVQLAIESDEFNKGDGKVISAYGEWLDLTEQVRMLGTVIGKKISYKKITEEESRTAMSKAGLPPHIIDDMSEMYKFHDTFWEATYIHSNRANLAREPRTFKEYCQNEDWSGVFN